MCNPVEEIVDVVEDIVDVIVDVVDAIVDVVEDVISWLIPIPEMPDFDDGGFKASKEHLIKDGVLLRGLGALERQERSEVPAVANFRSCSLYRAPIDRMANLNLES